MRVFHRVDELSPLLKQHSAVAIGNFDGCHLGHAELLKALLQSSKKLGVPSIVLTFFPHPVEVLVPSKPLERLTTAAEKLKLLDKMGVDFTCVIAFTPELAQVAAETFYETFIKNGLKAKSLHVGFNFHFGRDRVGNTEVLGAWCQRDGIELHVLKPFEIAGARVSSTSIRGLIRDGKVSQAWELLGRPYRLTGNVVHGAQRGSLLGYPTANLQVPEDKVLPKNGVYVTRVRWQKQWYRSVTNIGLRPTFPGATKTRPVVEIHFLDFGSRIYDEALELEILDRVRDEMRFSGPEELKEQISKDVEAAKRSVLFEKGL